MGADNRAALSKLNATRNAPMPGRKLRIQRWDETTLKPTNTILVLGKRGTGKSVIINSIMHALRDKLDAALATEAQILAGGDMGCLMNIAGRAKRLGKTIEVRHVAELLAGNLSKPAIGEGKS